VLLERPSTATSAARHLHSREQPIRMRPSLPSMINPQLEARNVQWFRRPGSRSGAINVVWPAQPWRQISTWSTGQLRASGSAPPTPGRERARLWGCAIARGWAQMAAAGHSD